MPAKEALEVFSKLGKPKANRPIKFHDNIDVAFLSGRILGIRAKKPIRLTPYSETR